MGAVESHPNEIQWMWGDASLLGLNTYIGHALARADPLRWSKCMDPEAAIAHVTRKVAKPGNADRPIDLILYFDTEQVKIKAADVMEAINKIRELMHEAHNSPSSQLTSSPLSSDLSPSSQLASSPLSSDLDGPSLSLPDSTTSKPAKKWGKVKTNGVGFQVGGRKRDMLSQLEELVLERKEQAKYDGQGRLVEHVRRFSDDFSSIENIYENFPTLAEEHQRNEDERRTRRASEEQEQLERTGGLCAVYQPKKLQVTRLGAERLLAKVQEDKDKGIVQGNFDQFRKTQESRYDRFAASDDQFRARGEEAQAKHCAAKNEQAPCIDQAELQEKARKMSARWNSHC